MSSKRRRRAREWMQRECARHDESIQHEREYAEERVASERRKWERIVAVEDGETIFPSGRVHQPVLRVRLREGLLTVMRDVALFAKQRSLKLPDGTKVVWWDWEARR